MTAEGAAQRRGRISASHRHAGLENPCASLTAKLALKRMSRERGTRQRQAAGLTRLAVERMIATTGRRPIDARDRALIAVAYDTLARRSELVAIEVADLAVAADGTGTVLIRRSKTHQEGKGSTRFLAADTMRHITAWIRNRCQSPGYQASRWPSPLKSPTATECRMTWSHPQSTKSCRRQTTNTMAR
jgi:integrase